MPYGFSALNNITSGKNTQPTSRKSIMSGRVKNIILDKDNPQFHKYGEWNGIGVIEWEDISAPTSPLSNLSTSYAYPLFPNIKFYPLINEVVTIIKLPSSNIDKKVTKTVNYYLPPINIWNNIHHNAIPAVANRSPSQQQDYEQTSVGSVRRVTDDSTEIHLGKTFTEKSNIHPLLPYEGDHIIEGRWGNSIRLGSTVKNSTTPNPWSKSGGEGDPITIIRNGQSAHTTPGWEPIIENIGTDDSSIYLTSTQQIPFFPSSATKNSFAPKDATPLSSAEYGGKQIILNSGRLNLNATSDSILISSPNTIHLSANKEIHFDSPTRTVISTGELFLGDRQATERLVKGDTLVKELKKLVVALEGLANSCTTSVAGPFPIPSLNVVGPSLSAAIKDFKISISGENPTILSKDVKTK
mgnify:FL=1